MYAVVSPPKETVFSLNQLYDKFCCLRSSGRLFKTPAILKAPKSVRIRLARSVRESADSRCTLCTCGDSSSNCMLP